MIIDYVRVPWEMQQEPRWCVWRKEIRDNKPTKIPYIAQGGWIRADSTNPDHYRDYVTALEVLDFVKPAYDGLGFFLGGGWVGIDLDHVIANDAFISEWPREFIQKCKNPDAMRILPPAAIVRQMGSYREVSPSGTGVKIIGRGTTPQHRKKLQAGTVAVEIYSDSRFFTITGRGGGQIRDIGNDATLLHGFLFGPPVAHSGQHTASAAAGELPERYETEIPDTEDKRVWQRIIASSDRPRLKEVMNGIWDLDRDESSDDYRLACILARHTRDAGQIERMMRSTCRMRDKWDWHTTYLTRTIDNALKNTEKRG